MSFEPRALTPAGPAIAMPAGDLTLDVWLAYAQIVLFEPEPALLRLWAARLEHSVKRLADAGLQSRSASEWFIAEVAPQTERKVSFALSQAGFAVFLPMETDWGKTHGKLDRAKIAYTPRFPGYVFVLIDQTYVDEKNRTQFRQVMETEGVTGFVDSINERGEVRPYPLSASEIIKLQADERAGRYDLTLGPVKTPPYRPRKGERVQVISGAYITWIGEVIATPKKTRVKVMFDDGRSPTLKVAQVKQIDEVVRLAS
jgi:transcription antitermination factor NusG